MGDSSKLVVAYFGGTNRNQILPQALASTAETELKVGTDSSSGTVTAVLSVPLQSSVYGSQTPLDQRVNPSLLNAGFSYLSSPGVPRPAFNSGCFDVSRPFLIRLAGTLTPASNAGNTITLKLYLGTSKAGTNLAATSAVAQASTTSTYEFLLEAQLKWSSGSGTIRGQFWYDVNGTTPAYQTWMASASCKWCTENEQISSDPKILLRAPLPRIQTRKVLASGPDAMPKRRMPSVRRVRA